MRGSRRENIASVKSAAQRSKLVSWILQGEYLDIRLFLRCLAVEQRHQAVIRADKKAAAKPRNNPAPVSAHARIHDAEMRGVGREIRRAAAQQQRGKPNILWRYGMTQVNDSRVRRDAEDDAFHDRRITVVIAEIGEQGDQFHSGCNSNKIALLWRANPSSSLR